MPMYTVKPGDCLTSIAAAHGFQDFKVIYNHADNKDFRDKRPNPHIIHPGDQIFIPPVTPLTFKVPVGSHKKMEVKRPPAELQVHLKDADGEPWKSKAYKIFFPPRPAFREGPTDGDGLVKEKVPATVAIPTLTIYVRETFYWAGEDGGETWSPGSGIADLSFEIDGKEITGKKAKTTKPGALKAGLILTVPLHPDLATKARSAA